MSKTTQTTRDDGPILGIDLGTTNSLAAVCDERGPRVLTGPDGERMLPSVVRLAESDGSVEAIGSEAWRTAVRFPGQTIFSVKRLMGRGLADVAGERAYLPYELVEGEHATARVKVGASVRSPQEISAMILQELRRWAEAALGQPVRRAVVTVPAYFDDAQRQATRDAGRIAGLEVVRIVNEPTAAALAYNVGHAARRKAARTAGKPSGVGDLRIGTGHCDSGAEGAAGAGDTAAEDTSGGGDASGGETVAVYDLGGGTFDISILRVEQTEQGTVDQVLATAGDTHLGGDDVDRLIVELIQAEVRERFGQTLAFPPATRQALRNFAEATKVRLSEDASATIAIDLGDGREFARTITRDELEAVIEPWVERTLDCCRRALRAADLGPGDIDRVVMVGGSTRVPLVQRRVAELFETEPYTALNPDEVVALGAAVQGSILRGDRRDTLLLDVIPLSLGIETLGGAVAKLITANSTIPARATEKFSTYVDGQTNVKVHVLQGERELAADCRSLGVFELRGIPPMPAGLPKLEVTFLVDANGVLSVSAVEQRSEKRASIQIVPNHGLTREEVERMEAESYEHAREDMAAHRLIDLRNQAKLDIRAIERQIVKVGEALGADYRGEIESKVAAVRALIDQDSPDLDALHAALDAMDKSTVRLAELAIAQTLREDQAAGGSAPQQAGDAQRGGGG